MKPVVSAKDWKFALLGLLGAWLLTAGLVGRAGPRSAMALTPLSRFWDNFENAKVLLDLFPADFSRWTGFELQPKGVGNVMNLSTKYAVSPTHSMSFFAVPSTSSSVSKCDLERTKILFKAGQTIGFSGSYYIAGNDNIAGLFICDIEGPPDSGRPGVRLIMTGGNDYLAVERGKFGASTIVQPEGSAIRFPRNRWVKVRWVMKLSQQDNGAVEVWQDDRRIIMQEHVITMPSDSPPVLVGTDGTYTEWQVGITANTKNSAVQMYIDDVELGVK